ncbi:MAG TPA: ferredoxin-type protein NapF [Campylobacterales bacterium]|nr:ferredoxin-type protein NapF [Campylobacterales bacterium]
MASRRDLFKSFTKPLVPNQEEEIFLVRPPYGKDESIFQNKCPSCEYKACVTSCDEKIIFIAEDGTPTLSFKQNGCTFCDECANACIDGVLSLENIETSENLNIIFHIDFHKCIAHEGVICHSCKEPCIDDAILFNGMFNPIIDENRCTGCGFCISRCPTMAIDYTRRKNEF